MADTPDLDQLVEHVHHEQTELVGMLTPGDVAKYDQEVAVARQACLDVGLDLTDPAVAATILRFSHAIGVVIDRLPEGSRRTIVLNAASAPLSSRSSALARWVAAGHIACAASGAFAPEGRP